MKAVGNCKDCEHWKPGEYSAAAEWQGFGTCSFKHERLRLVIPPPSPALRGKYAGFESALRTRADFGCMEFTAMEVGKK